MQKKTEKEIIGKKGQMENKYKMVNLNPIM